MRRIVLASLTLVLALPAAAPAQQPNDDGVFVDPDSPTSKEYAVPTEEARGSASGGPGSSSAGSDSSGGSSGAPLFGAGIDGERGAGSGAGGRGRGDSGTAGSSATSPPSESLAAARRAGNVTRSTDAGVSPTAWGIGIALAVLLAAAGIAFFLKRREGWTFPLGGRAN